MEHLTKPLHELRVKGQNADMLPPLVGDGQEFFTSLIHVIQKDQVCILSFETPSNFLAKGLSAQQIT